MTVRRGSVLVAIASLVAACSGDGGSPDASTDWESGQLSVEFVLDTTTDFADYEDGYELFLELDGPEVSNVDGAPVGERTVLLERVVPFGDYRVRAGLLPCGIFEQPCGPRRDSCTTEVTVASVRQVLTVDFQPGRPCTFELG